MQLFIALQTATDYGPYIQNLPSPLHTTSIVEACTQLLVDQWHYLRANVRSVHASRMDPCLTLQTHLPSDNAPWGRTLLGPGVHAVGASDAYISTQQSRAARDIPPKPYRSSPSAS